MKLHFLESIMNGGNSLRSWGINCLRLKVVISSLGEIIEENQFSVLSYSLQHCTNFLLYIAVNNRHSYVLTQNLASA